MYRNVALLLVLIALASSALGGPGKEKFRELIAKCISESGIDPESLKGGLEAMMESTDDPKMGCFHACMMKNRGDMDEDGSLNIENAIAHLPPDVPDRDRIVKAIEECGTKKGENDCETAHEVFKCLQEKNALPNMHGPRGPH